MWMLVILSRDRGVTNELRTIPGQAVGIKWRDARSYLMIVSTHGEETPLQGADERERFEHALLPHLDAAYNLARWLTRDDHDAEDLVQAAYLRAVKFFGGFHGTNGRAWLLTIVRKACYTFLEQKRARGPATAFDEEIHGFESRAMGPEKLVLREEDQQSVRGAVEELPVELREVVVLRELEGLSYKEIAAIAGIPMGTVMSRLARARTRLHERLGGCGDGGS
jgi:RNA polymerase sigma factor (sigma-70 family)